MANPSMKTLLKSRYNGAFTLVEIMVVVVIIGLLAAVALPAFSRVTKKTRVSSFINDLKKFEEAVALYSQANGVVPPDYNAGIKPTELAEYLPKLDFTVPTQLKGLWDWDDHNTYHRISVEGMSSDDSRLVDEAIDDGNLETGVVQFDGHFRYFIWRS